MIYTCYIYIVTLTQIYFIRLRSILLITKNTITAMFPFNIQNACFIFALDTPFSLFSGRMPLPWLSPQFHVPQSSFSLLLKRQTASAFTTLTPLHTVNLLNFLTCFWSSTFLGHHCPSYNKFMMEFFCYFN